MQDHIQKDKKKKKNNKYSITYYKLNYFYKIKMCITYYKFIN